MLDNTKRLLEEWGADLVADVLAALADRSKIATGRLYLSIREELLESIDELELLVYEEDYGKFVDKGRGPGKQPPLQAIKEWARIKGIPEKYAYPIARRIGRFGTRPTNYFSVPLGVRLAILDQSLPDSLREDLIIRLRELSQRINES